MINILAKFFVKKVATDYDAIAENFSETRERPWEGWQLLKKYFGKGKDILDIGCGNGRAADFFEYKSYTGIDISRKLIKIAKKTHNAKKVRFEVGNCTDLHSSKKFDLAVAVAVFHHLPSPKIRVLALRNVHSALKKDGVFIFSVWNLFQEKYRAQRLAALLRSIFTFGIFHPRDLFIPWKKGPNKRKRYYYALKKKEVSALLRKTGFEPIDIIPESNGKRVEIKNAHNIYFICRENRKTPR